MASIYHFYLTASSCAEQNLETAEKIAKKYQVRLHLLNRIKK